MKLGELQDVTLNGLDVEDELLWAETRIAAELQEVLDSERVRSEIEDFLADVLTELRSSLYSKNHWSTKGD